MADDDSLEKALYDMKGVIALLQANLFNMVKVKDVKEAEELLAGMEAAVEEFVKNSKRELGRFALSREQRDLIDQGIIPENLDKGAKEALHMSIELKAQVEAMRQLAKREQGSFDSDEPSSSPPEAELTKQLKRRFKRLGGDKWKPL